MRATVGAEATATGRGIEGAEWRILRAILDGRDWNVEAAVLVRVGGLCEPPGTGERALDGLVLAGWVARWRPSIRAKGGKPRVPLGPDVATLTPWGAEQLGVALIEPAQDDPDGEPRWGRADPEHFDDLGRHPDEPDHFLIEPAWGQLRRARVAFEVVVRNRAEFARKSEQKGKAARKRADKGRRQSA